MKKDQGSDSLFRLVQSLDANERGYIKKFLKRHSEKGNVNLDLVEALEKQKEYNEAPLKKQFKNLAVVKVQAWDEIMDALRMFHKLGSHPTIEPFYVLTQFVILNRKGLKEDAKKIYDKLVKKCYEKEDFYTLIEMLTLATSFYNEKNNKKPFAVFWEENMTELISLIDKLKEIYEYNIAAGKLYYMKQNSHQENYLEDITAFKKFCTLFDKEPSSVHAKLRYYDMRAFYYDAIGDTVSYIRYLESSRVLMDKKKTTIDISDIHYNNICLYLIIAYIKIGNYKKAERLLYDEVV